MADGLNHDNEMVTFILHMTLNAGRDVEEECLDACIG